MIGEGLDADGIVQRLVDDGEKTQAAEEVRGLLHRLANEGLITL
jgi:hypothetical protein